MRDLIAGAPGAALLLGVTPEYAALATPLTAVDTNQAMIDHVWPGDDGARQAICVDWREMAFAPASFGVAFGDGSLNMLRFPDEVDHVVARLRPMIVRGGRLCFRCFTAPDVAPDFDTVRSAALAGAYGFHELKWRVATMLAHRAEGWNVEGREILAAFDRLFPDRRILAEATGWPLSTIAEIDDYRDAVWTMCFPTRDALECLLADADWIESGDYAMADLCPILVITP